MAKVFQNNKTKFSRKLMAKLLPYNMTQFSRKLTANIQKPNIMSRHNVVYVEACSFDNPLGGFVPGTKLRGVTLNYQFVSKVGF